MLRSGESSLYCGGCQTTPAAAAAPVGERCGLCPLACFYDGTLQPMPVITEVAADEIPAPYRQLLAHSRDMTSTLEQHYGAAVRLQLLHRRTNRGIYQREVVLVLETTQQPVEFGAITIYLEPLSPELEAAVVAARRPLGALLQQAGIAFCSRPKAYIRLAADGVMTAALKLPAVTTLYGRCNGLWLPDGRRLADIVEILAP